MERNNTYDIAKCWAIFSVIVYHVIIIIYNNQPIHSFVDTYFLTLFFFISGLLTKQEKVSQNGWLKKQTIHLLVPFTTVFLLYRIYQHYVSGNPIFSALAFDDSKSGFWFILTLYCFLLTIKLLIYALRMVNNKFLYFVILIAPFFVVAVLCLLLSYDVAGYFSLMSFRRYWLFFVYGYVISNYCDYKKLVLNRHVRYLSLPLYIAFASVYILKVQDVSSNLDFLIWSLANFAGCHFYIVLFEWFKEPLSKGIILSTGQNTLGIYLLHYFPLSCAILLLGSRHLLCDNPLNYLYATITILTILATSLFLTWAVKRNSITAFLFLGIERK